MGFLDAMSSPVLFSRTFNRAKFLLDQVNISDYQRVQYCLLLMSRFQKIARPQASQSNVDFKVRIYFLIKLFSGWSGTNYFRIHFLPFTRDDRGSCPIYSIPSIFVNNFWWSRILLFCFCSTFCRDLCFFAAWHYKFSVFLYRDTSSVKQMVLQCGYIGCKLDYISCVLFHFWYQALPSQLNLISCVPIFHSLLDKTRPFAFTTIHLSDLTAAELLPLL